MSLSTIALASMIPSAARTIGSAASSTLRASGDFLSSLTEGSAGEAAASNAVGSVSAKEPGSTPRSELQAKTEAWGRKLVQFLRSRGVEGPINLSGALNELDQPEIQALGENQEAIEQALKETADFFSEFRELAFEAAAQRESQAGSWTSDSQGSSLLSSTRLSLSESFGSLTADWNVQ